MEELQSLVKVVSGLPHLAIYALAIFYAYKVVVIGSIYGVIRFAVTKVSEILMTKKAEVPPPVVELKIKELNTKFLIPEISGQLDDLLAEVIKDHNSNLAHDDHLTFFHYQHLRTLISAYRTHREAKNKKGATGNE